MSVDNIKTNYKDNRLLAIIGPRDPDIVYEISLKMSAEEYVCLMAMYIQLFLKILVCVNCKPIGDTLPEVVAIELYEGDGYIELIVKDQSSERTYYVGREKYVKNLELLFNLPFQRISSYSSDPKLLNVVIKKDKTPDNTRLIVDGNDKPVAFVRVQF
ncbi:unnamed protein product [Oppiella nova]|uniref:Uncharacterized protein n=1 Tax=Oppiella nova TaxID=334625 RepID=A0A7R9MJA3_9ACAR|nr:unnamed protein product [Oppiella nova]CAG2177255.1 unnamed protein product [Oppiella nova]